MRLAFETGSYGAVNTDSRARLLGDGSFDEDRHLLNRNTRSLPKGRAKLYYGAVRVRDEPSCYSFEFADCLKGVTAMSERYSKETDAERAARRRFLKRASLLLGAGLTGPAAAKAALRRSVDIGGIPVGGTHTVLFDGVPVLILNRSRETLAALERDEDVLADPESRHSQQPAFADNPWRSRVPEWLVMVNVCTHAGCRTRYESRLEHGAGGFHCPCHGARYDAAGRVFKNQPAPWNMVVPDYEIDVAGKRIHVLSVEPMRRDA